MLKNLLKYDLKWTYKGVIVFSHGLGAGHNQYTTEIENRSLIQDCDLFFITVPPK